MAIDTTLAQDNPGPVLTSIYTVPTGRRAAVYVVMTNTTTTAQTYRVALAISGAVDALSQYVVYDASVSTIPQATRRMALGAGDVIRVYASTTDVNFCVNGIEQDV